MEPTTTGLPSGVTLWPPDTTGGKIREVSLLFKRSSVGGGDAEVHSTYMTWVLDKPPRVQVRDRVQHSSLPRVETLLGRYVLTFQEMKNLCPRR